MNKRQFLTRATVLSATTAPAFAFAAKPARHEACNASPVVLTITGSIKRRNRGALDPAFDQLLAKHPVKWATYDADNIAELSSKPLKDRFELSPWGLYHLQVIEA